MAADGQIIFEIQGDNRPLRQTLQDTTGDIERETRRWDRATDDAAGGMESSFTGALKSMGAAIAASGIAKMLMDFGKQAIDAASDLEEVQNVVDVTFEESASEIDSWAKNAIKQFGLTETQAKRFASTMGAMMKSSGIASKDIVEMSENLSGLAADMASFYNLDFDEAFNKIRSGISGETEPLKQLGINMSVANLEAFALAQGIDKAFDKMSQSEQIMLRYQYMMQATADAQGDFARTSDGFANGLRLLQSNFESLKTTVGSLLLPVVSEAIAGLNSMLSLLIPETKQRTVLDDFADIDLKTEAKIQDIKDTADKALGLVDILDEIQGADIAGKGTEIESVSSGANLLSSDAGTNWANFIDGLDGIDDVVTASDGGKEAEADLKGIASGGEALTGTPERSFKYENLPPKIRALYDEAVKANGIKKDLETIDTESGELTKNGTNTFKYSSLGEQLGGFQQTLETAAGNIPGKVGELDQAAGKLTGANNEPFKFQNLQNSISEFINEADRITTENTSGDIDTLKEAAASVQGSDSKPFKYEALKGEISEFIGVADSVITNQTKDDLNALAEGAGEVSGTPETFKYDGFGAKIKEVVDNADGGTEAGKQIAGLSKASEVAGNTLGFKFDGFGAKVKEVVENSSGGIVAGIQMSGLADGADKLAGQKKTFSFSAWTSSTDGVGALISAAQGGTSAGTELKNLGDGAQAVAGVQYTQGGSIGAMASDIKMLDSTSKRNWTAVLNVFNNIPGYTKKIDAKKIEDIAGAFSGLEGDKAAAWNTLMDALGSDLSALSALTGEDEEGAAAWLQNMKEAANGLNADDVHSWDTLFSLLVNKTSGAGNFITAEDMAALARSVGLPAETIQKLGDGTTATADKQAEWLEVCKRLVQTMPELADMINTETGEIKGGTTALRERIKALQEQKTQEALLYGIQQKREALDKKFAELPSLRVDAAVAKMEYEKAKKALDDFNESIAQYKAYVDDTGNIHFLDGADVDAAMAAYDALDDETFDLINRTRQLELAYDGVSKEYERQYDAYEKASAQYDELEKDVKDAAEAQKNGAGTAKEYNDAQKKAATDGVKALTDALKEMNDYIESTRKSTQSSVDSALGGMKRFETASAYIERLKKESGDRTEELTKQLNEAREKGTGTWEIELKISGEDKAVPSLQNMRKTFEDNLAFINEYQANLELAKKNGASDELLAQFADFSQENAGYLHLLAHGTPQEVKAVTDAYAKMAEAKKPLVEALTETKLKADESFNELVAKAKEAAVQLNAGDVAKESMASTVQGIADGIAEKVPEVKAEVDALNAELARLGSLQNLDVFGGLDGGGISFKFTPDGTFAKGTDYIPFDNYLAYLHEGEAVLTAEEAALWRNFKNGGANLRNSIDYGQLSGAIWDSAPSMGGDVYLDGRAVGRVISAQQANSYRALERSGWQG